MTGSFDTPVVLILFNRPDRIRELIAVLRSVRPTRILAIADGPRESRSGDHRLCAAARAELDGIDWPCRIEREFAPANLGCDPRTVSGLDWAFSTVDRAIVLEDDVLPHPSFFPWAVAMLDRFADDPEVTMVSGRNPLGRWGGGDSDHLRVRWASSWGWATTARWWWNIRDVELAGRPARAIGDAARPATDALVAHYFGLALQDYRAGRAVCWDVAFELCRYLIGGVAIVAPVNLIQNTGIGPDATNTVNTDDLNALIPIGSAPAAVPSGASRSDDAFDRAALLFHLMSQWADPTMARRLARALAPGSALPVDAHVRLALAPFTVPGESLKVLEHVAAQGVSSPHFDVLVGAMSEATPTKANDS